MSDYYEVRWAQRFQNFERAFLLLQQTVNMPSLSVIERAGMIQFFEMSFELAWKVLKDYQELEGFIIKSPRDAIKQAFQYQLIEDGGLWLEALKDRNLTVHTYQEQTAKDVEEKIKLQYYPLLHALYETFTAKLAELK
ncbi:nucleotidyltransferase substrate binding protein [uncultured Shewanella sp.]|uniref:nucleotidyltransferase substrate binding protein n=1 Tax=uncultured Shewanella sp. TaxID=173975 RepID=UPI002620D301|nr:nucleotidyltransferase substrate binding protein [uncultured Shewanella sp.]